MTATESIQIKWDSSLYDNKHDFVFKYGEDLLNLLLPQKDERILDLGCGTGYLTSCIAAAGAIVTAIDSSAEMIQKARLEYPGIDFRVSSATVFLDENRFDAIFSNAVLHWIKEKELVIDRMFRNLKSNGRLIMEMGGKQNVDGILNALKTVLQQHGFTEQAAIEQWYFPSLSEYCTLLERRGFRVTFAAHFNRETELKNTEHGIGEWIKMFGASYLKNIPALEMAAILGDVETMLRPTHYCEEKWWADYRRLRIVAIKEHN